MLADDINLVQFIHSKARTDSILNMFDLSPCNNVLKMHNLCIQCSTNPSVSEKNSTKEKVDMR